MRRLRRIRWMRRMKGMRIMRRRKTMKQDEMTKDKRRMIKMKAEEKHGSLSWMRMMETMQ
jgi:hypothetical protein